MEQRQDTRHEIDWAAGYRLFASTEWLPCRAVNMGKGGVAIEPLELSGDEFVGDIEIRFELAGDDTFELHGSIRHRTRTHRGGVLLGVEFPKLTTGDLKLLEALRTTSTVPV
jgi:hypothetical protein